jgi:Protein of unknown function (DUF3303)
MRGLFHIVQIKPALQLQRFAGHSQFPKFNSTWRLSAMKVMLTWSAKPGKYAEAANLFLTGHAVPPDGATLLGRWHSLDIGTGFVLLETDDATLIFRNNAVWADILDIEASIVLEDSEAGPIIAEKYQK